MTVTAEIPETAEHIAHRVHTIEELEMELVGLSADLIEAETREHEIVNGYYARGIEGSNERIRQANLADLLRADAEWPEADRRVRELDGAVKMLRISIDSNKRLLALEMEQYRHMRPVEA